VGSYRISPDSERVVFIADREVAGRLDLYSVPIDGRPGLRKLDQALLSTRDVLDFAISPDGRAVVYRANAPGQDQLDLFRVPIEGLDPPARRTSGEIRKGSRIRLSQLPDAYQTESDYAFTADGTQVLFRINSPGAPQRFDLFRVPADGSSAPVRLSDELPSRRQTVSSFALSPDQSRVVYLSDAVAWQRFELFSVPLAGGPVVRLDSLPSFADVSSYRIDPLSRRVVYLADRIADEALELFEVPLDGSAPAERLNMPLPANGDVESDFVPLLGGRTLYRADQTTNDVLEVFVSQEWRILPR
jgi:Tol biopolymer transport system component